jgi:CheY-like chemotaxis protein/nitrogen-specific signal transduction histidine kinase
MTPEQPRSTRQPSNQAFSGRLDDRFLSVLGHELRNPIAAVAMAAEALARLCADAPDKKAMTDVIYRQARQATRLLDAALDIARLASGRIELRPERVDLVAHLEDAVGARKSQVEAKSQKLRFEAFARPIWIEADPARLTQVIGCLIDNAVKFTEPHGQIVITAGLCDEGTHARVEVRDTGIGIDPADLPTIFEPFRPAGGGGQTQRGGLGLGLPLAKGLIELHGGSISAESEGRGKGANFRVLLPLSARPTNRAATDQPGAKGQQRLRVLIIDDSPDVATSLQFLLKHAGHEIAVAPDGTRGIEAARRVAPDVILCDIGLPDIDGYAVAQSLRADPTTAGSFLIAVSGYASEEDQRRSLEAGFDLHLNKPEGFVGLSERLASLPIGKHRAPSV